MPARPGAVNWMMSTAMACATADVEEADW